MTTYAYEIPGRMGDRMIENLIHHYGFSNRIAITKDLPIPQDVRNIFHGWEASLLAAAEVWYCCYPESLVDVKNYSTFFGGCYCGNVVYVALDAIYGPLNGYKSGISLDKIIRPEDQKSFVEYVKTHLEFLINDWNSGEFQIACANLISFNS